MEMYGGEKKESPERAKERRSENERGRALR
jgi:hypothetical protein